MSEETETKLQEFLDELSPLGITIRVGVTLLLGLVGIIVAVWFGEENDGGLDLPKWLLISGVTMLVTCAVAVSLLIAALKNWVSASWYLDFKVLMACLMFSWGILGGFVVVGNTDATGLILKVTSIIVIITQLLGSMWVFLSFCIYT